MCICRDNMQHMRDGNRLDTRTYSFIIQHDTLCDELHQLICYNDCISFSDSSIPLHGLTSLGTYSFLHYSFIAWIFNWHLIDQLLYRKVGKAKYSGIFYVSS